MLKNLDRALRILRTRRGLSQGELADAAGLTTSTISRIESGQSDPTYRTLEKIAPVLDTTAEGIFELTFDLSKRGE